MLAVLLGLPSAQLPPVSVVRSADGVPALARSRSDQVNMNFSVPIADFSLRQTYKDCKCVILIYSTFNHQFINKLW